MTDHVSKRGKTWAYWFDIDSDQLTGKRRQQTRSGFKSEREAWKECRAAIADYERGRVVAASRHNVAAELDEWLTRIEHSIKPSMAQNTRRDLLDLDAGTLTIEVTRVVVDGRVIESDGKTENAQHVLALDPFMLAVLKAHVEQLDRERQDFGPDAITASCSAGRTADPRTPTRLRGGSRSSPRRPRCRRWTCTTCGTATPRQVAMRRSTGRR